MSSNAMRDAQFCRAGRFCERLWPFLVVKAASSAKIAPTQHNEGVNCDQLVGLLEPIAQPTHVFRPFFARSPKVLTKKFKVGGGTIVNISSVEGALMSRRNLAYATVKRAVSAPTPQPGGVMGVGSGFGARAAEKAPFRGQPPGVGVR